MFKKRRSTNPGTSESNHGPSGLKRRRIVDCTKTLLDIAKESADWFPPLKAVLGGVSALVKHYEQYQDVKEKIMGLIPQLDRFKQNIIGTEVDGDPGETVRRRRLVSAFKEIEELSQKLLTKSAIARFADRGEDSKIVVGLVERLREAIVCYQISQQQAIYHQITHLTSSFDTFLKLQEKPSVSRQKLESITARLNKLGDAPWGELHNERWTKLFDDLVPIKDRAKELYKRIAVDGYVEDEGDVAAVSGLAEDLRDVLLEYWMVQQQEVYDQNCRLIDAADLSVLNGCRRAQGVEFRHGNRRSCLNGTRETVLDEIESWAKDFDKSPVFWLNGLAGTGKSTIAQTVAERIFAEERLGASFFCSRDFEDRSNLHFLFPSLAFQLAYKYSEFRSHFVSLLKSNPDVAHESLYRQMQKLIAEPLRISGVSTVIVIDALDECKDDEPSSAILSVLGRFIEQIPGVKFFITGRPEPRVRTGFRLPLLVDSTDVFVLHDVHPSLINSDIRLFLKHELSELAQRNQMGAWPSDENIDLLCRRAAGLFVYAVATVKFISSDLHLPERRLGVIVGLPESTVPEGGTLFNSNTTLDSLYTSILEAAFSKGDSDAYSKIRTTIGAIVLVVNPLPPPAIAELVGLDAREVMKYLTQIQSLLAIGEDSNKPVKPFHKSFPDFITDPSRCTKTKFYISPGHSHSELVKSCLRVMSGGLKRNILSLPEYSLNSEVKDLQARIDGRLSVALQYACRSWHSHLTEVRRDDAVVSSHIWTFLEEKFLEWLEVLSVLGDIRGAVAALEHLMAWLQEVTKKDPLSGIARDCFHFVTTFFEPISASATHIYHSALELCPVSSAIRRLYYDRHNRIAHLPRVVIGTPDSLEPVISFSGKDHEYGFCTWSPCGQFVAAQKEKAVEVRGRHTFELVSIMEPVETTLRLTGPLAYSFDGRSLACVSDVSVVVWDIQTGGIAQQIECRTDNISMEWSPDGREIVTAGDWEAPSVNTYDIATGATLSIEKFRPGDSLHLRRYNGSLLVMAMRIIRNTASIDTFEVGGSPTKIHSFSISASNNPNIPFSVVTYDLDTFPSSTTPDIRRSLLISNSHNSPVTPNIFCSSLTSDGSFSSLLPPIISHYSLTPVISPSSLTPDLVTSDISFSSATLDITFSPATHHLSIRVDSGLRAFRRGYKLHLLRKAGRFFSHCYSADGSLFAASEENGVRIWKCSTEDYVPSWKPLLERYSPWKIFRPQDCVNSSLQFLPTSSSLLVHSRSILQVWRLDDLPIEPSASRTEPQYLQLAGSSNYLMVYHPGKGIISTVDVHSKSPRQTIDPGVMVDALVVINNVLLVKGGGEAIAWLLTEEGCVVGVTPGRAGHRNSIWNIELPHLLPDLTCKVEGQVGVIECGGHAPLVFDTKSGQIFQPTVQAPQFFGDPPNLLRPVLCGRDYSHPSQRNTPPEDVWQTSETTLREGWVKDPKGRHKLWIPVEWRAVWDLADWCHDIKTQFSVLRGQPIIVKF